jgi:hypothetical protein
MFCLTPTNWNSSRHNGGGDPVEAHNVVEEAAGGSPCSVGVAERQKMHRFGKPDHDEV